MATSNLGAYLGNQNNTGKKYNTKISKQMKKLLKQDIDVIHETEDADGIITKQRIRVNAGTHFAMQAYKYAIAGHVGFAALILDRTEGKVPEKDEKPRDNVTINVSFARAIPDARKATVIETGEIKDAEVVSESPKEAAASEPRSGLMSFRFNTNGNGNGSVD